MDGDAAAASAVTTIEASRSADHAGPQDDEKSMAARYTTGAAISTRIAAVREGPSAPCRDRGPTDIPLAVMDAATIQSPPSY